MLIKPEYNPPVNVTLANNDHVYFMEKVLQQPLNNTQPNIIQNLLNEISRVKELINHYNSLPDTSNVPIFSELVAEAQNSLVNYDIILINKYYELLQNCD